MAAVMQPILKVVDTDTTQGLKITVEGADSAIVDSAEARKLVLKTAENMGFMNIGINNTSGSYVVDENGKLPEGHDDNSMYLSQIKLVETGKFKFRNTYTIRSTRP